MATGFDGRISSGRSAERYDGLTVCCRGFYVYRRVPSNSLMVASTDYSAAGSLLSNKALNMCLRLFL